MPAKFKFVPGVYKTRDGREAHVLCDDAPGKWPLAGYVVTADGQGVNSVTWSALGYLNEGVHGADLTPTVTEPEQVVRWVCLWDDGDHTTDEELPDLPSGVIARTRVVLTPGVFDDENTPDPYTRGWNEALEAAGDLLTARGFYTLGAEAQSLKRSAP